MHRADNKPLSTVSDGGLGALEHEMLDRLVSSTPQAVNALTPEEDMLDEATLEKISARLERPLTTLEREILSRPLPASPDLSVVSYKLLIELQNWRGRLLSTVPQRLGSGKNTHHWEMRSHVFTPAVFLPVLLIPVFFVSTNFAAWTGMALALGIGISCLMLLINLDEWRMAQHVARELRDLSLVHRVIEADPTLSDIRTSVLPPWSWLFFRGSHMRVLDLMRLLCANLDWYLRPPRMLLRWSWLAGTLGGLLLPAALLGSSLGLGWLSNTAAWTTALSGTVLLVLAVRHETDRRAYFIDKLIELIRRP